MLARIRTARRRPIPLLPLLGLSTLTLSACSVGPDYQPPQPSTPSAFNDLRSIDRTASWGAGRAVKPKVVARTFNDAQLDSLIDRSIAGNLSLQQAVLRIAGAREQTLQAGAAGLSTVSANASATRQQLGLKGELDSVWRPHPGD